MNQPYLFCLCVLCNLKNEFFYWLSFISLFLGLFEGPSQSVLGVSSWNTFEKHYVLCQTHYVLKTVTIEGNVSPVLINQSSTFVGLERWVNFTQASKVYSKLYVGRRFWNQAHLQRLMPKYFQALVLVSLCRFTGFVRALKTCENPWTVRVLFQGLESPRNSLSFILVLESPWILIKEHLIRSIVTIIVLFIVEGNSLIKYSQMNFHKNGCY